ncbi:MAG: hypothetical protein AAF581_20750 [Planctomycetota bacterium]
MSSWQCSLRRGLERGLHRHLLAALLLGLVALPPAAAGDATAALFVPHVGESSLDVTIQKLQRQLQQPPRPAPLLRELGWCFVGKARASHDPGYYKLAEIAAREVTRKHADDFDAALLLGHALHNLHSFAAAEEVARGIVVRRGLAVDHALLGDALLEQGKLSAAVHSYEKMMDLRPGPAAYGRAAQVRWLHGDVAGAVEAMAWAARSTGGDPAIDAWHRVQLGTWVLHAGHPKQAQQLAAAALQLAPSYAPALFLSGQCHVALDELAAAAVKLARAVEVAPLPANQWALLEVLRAQQVTRPAGPATAPRGTGDVAAAIAALESQLLGRGSAADPRTVALYLATQDRDHERALQLAEAELQSRRDVYTHDAVAWAAWRAGRREKALSHLQSALATGCLDPRMHLHAAAIRRSCLDLAGARAALRVVERFRCGLLRSEQRLADELAVQLSAHEQKSQVPYTKQNRKRRTR